MADDHEFVVAVLGPTLPTELLAEIVTLAGKLPESESVESEWAERDHYTALKALCLTSRTLNELATPLLYAILVVPTAEAGQALVRTLQSERWQGGELVGKAKEWAKAAVFGMMADAEGEMNGGFVDGVLDELSGAELSRVRLAGLRVGMSSFWRMANVRVLHLSHVTLACGSPRHTTPTLTHLTHLTLTETREAPTDHFCFFIYLSFPSLTHLAVAATQAVRASGELVFLAFFRFVSRLEAVALREPSGDSGAQLRAEAAQLARLRYLAMNGASEPGEASPLAGILAAMPRSLETLDLAPAPFAAGLAEAACEAFEHGHVGVGGLERLRLPRKEGLALCSGEDVGEAGEALDRVAEVAEARGVAVEWVRVQDEEW